MDAFEELIGGLLSQNGYWITQGYKVALTREEKVTIGRPFAPRWEIDIIAYSGRRQELIAVECKSYLDSQGVNIESLLEIGNRKSRYKLFTDEALRTIVLKRLRLQMIEKGLIPEDVEPKLGFAVGKFKSGESARQVSELCARNGWPLFGPDWIKNELRRAADTSYFDSVSHIVSKLLLRK